MVGNSPFSVERILLNENGSGSGSDDGDIVVVVGGGGVFWKSTTTSHLFACLIKGGCPSAPQSPRAVWRRQRLPTSNSRVGVWFKRDTTCSGGP
jgi:hypothetical protein